MRSKQRGPCYNPDKSHLHRLPDLEEHEAPTRLHTPSSRGLVLITQFEARPNDHHIPHHGGVSAAWARRSWIKYSDASDFGIEVKLYIEERLRDQDGVIETLRENQIGEEDILWFNADHLEGVMPHRDGGFVTHGGKKCAMFTDRQLQDYEWVFQFDSDIFVMQSSKKLPFFQRFFEKTPHDSIAAAFLSTGSDPRELGATRDVDAQFSEEGLAGFKKRVRSGFGQETLDSLREGFMAMHGGMEAFPARHFMSERWEDCEWLSNAAYWLLCDESVLTVWHKLGNPIFDMTDLEIAICLIADPFSKWTVSTVEAMVNQHINQEPFILHYGANIFEMLWREGIGAL